MCMLKGAGTSEAERNTSAQAEIRPFLHVGLCVSYQAKPQTDWRIPGP